MKVLVAGSSGMVGSAVSDAFSRAGYETFGLNRSNNDLRNLEATKRFLKTIKPDIVIDAAAKVGGIGANNDFPVDFLLHNLAIQSNLMTAAHEANVDRFVFLGSSCIYPRDCAQPIKEEYLMTGPLEKSNSAYAMAKIAGIELVNSYRRQYGRKWISLMPTNLYGPNDNFNLAESHVIPALIRKFVDAADCKVESVTLWGTGSPRREFLHVLDLAQAVLFVTENYDSQLHLNVGTGLDITIFDLAQKIAEIAGFKGVIKWDSARLDGTPQKLLDISRIQEIGWTPTITLSEGLFSTVQWFREASEKGLART
jgi:GDP-L-fucose synthase